MADHSSFCDARGICFVLQEKLSPAERRKEKWQREKSRSGFPKQKWRHWSFFLKENDTTVEKVLREHLDKTYEKSVPQQVRKFVESKMTPQTEEPAQNEAGNARHGRGQGRRSTRQQTARETVSEQENNGAEQAAEQETQEPEQEQTGGMSMSM